MMLPKSGPIYVAYALIAWGIELFFFFFLAKSWKANPGKYPSVLESFFVNKISNTEKKWLMNPKKSAVSL